MLKTIRFPIFKGEINRTMRDFENFENIFGDLKRLLHHLAKKKEKNGGGVPGPFQR